MQIKPAFTFYIASWALGGIKGTSRLGRLCNRPRSSVPTAARLFLAHAPASVFGTHSSKLLLAHLSTSQQSDTEAAAAAAVGTGQVPSLSLVPAGYEEVVKV